MKKKTLNVPTILTLIRIILVVPLLILMLSDGIVCKILAIVCFVTASLTDFIDGRLARKNHQVTDLGAFLDPLADKMLVNLTFLVLVYMGYIPLVAFAIILVRDFAVDGMRMMVARRGETVAASIYGKAKTMTQMITLTLFLVNLCLNNAILFNISTVLLYVVLALTVFSGVDYLVKGWNKAIK